MDEIRRILADHGGLTADVEGLADDDDLYSLGLTSHATVTVMLACEEAFGVEFPQSELRRSTFASIASLRSVLAGLGADATAGASTRSTE